MVGATVHGGGFRSGIRYGPDPIRHTVLVGAGCAYICFLRPPEIGAGEDTGRQEGFRAGSGITMLLALGLPWQPVEPTVQSL